MATPLEISIALHYLCRTDDYGKCGGDRNWSAPAVQASLRRFVEAGLLEIVSGDPNDCQYRATEGLKMYGDLLGAVAWPVKIWVSDARLCTHTAA